MSLPKHKLHEAISKKFDRTPKGAIFTKDLKIIYSLLLICLNLTDNPTQKSSKVSFLSKTYPFSFSLESAISTMENLSSTIESSATKTTISYSIKPELANMLIQKFMDAKLLHTPADRTRSEPKSKVLLQPTPKGVAILQSYCKMFGLKNQQNSMPILNSTFNSMDLFVFERSSITDTVVHSEYFIYLLYLRFVGPKPNIWKPSNPPDEIPSVAHRSDIVDEFDFSNFQNESFQFTSFEEYQQYQNHSQQNLPQDDPSSKPDSSTFNKNKLTNLVTGVKKAKISRESPFSHNFFTNPESDSHVQYYVSNKGVRLYEDYQFGNSLKVKCCFNAKAAWQWLMDCTDIMYPREAVLVLNLFYKYGLIEPIIVPPSTANSQKHFLPLKTSIYTLSKRGWDISEWTGKRRKIARPDDDGIISDVAALTLNDSPEVLSLLDEENLEESTITNLSIKEVLADPGMRYLFRNHLEKEYCAENLDVYIDIKHFSKKMAILKSLLEAYNKKKVVKLSNATIKPPSKKTLVKLVNECLSVIYHIYSSYITVGAPYELNIDHLLRGEITNCMLHSSSPLKSHFSERFNLVDTIVNDETKSPSYKFSKPEKAHIHSKQLISPIVSPVGPESIVPSHTPIMERRLQGKSLSIDIISPRFNDDTPKTPTNEEVTKSLDLLYQLNPLIDAVGKQILKMLEFDSFPKFLKSQTFLDASTR